LFFGFKYRFIHQVHLGFSIFFVVMENHGMSKAGHGFSGSEILSAVA